MSIIYFAQRCRLLINNFELESTILTFTPFFKKMITPIDNLQIYRALSASVIIVSLISNYLTLLIAGNLASIGIDFAIFLTFSMLFTIKTDDFLNNFIQKLS